MSHFSITYEERPQNTSDTTEESIKDGGKFLWSYYQHQTAKINFAGGMITLLRSRFVVYLSMLQLWGFCFVFWGLFCFVLLCVFLHIKLN